MNGRGAGRGGAPGPAVTIVVLSYNGADDTVACLESLRRGRGGLGDVIVVDNASGDGTVPRLRASFPGLEIIASPVNRGFSGGMNLGIARALARGSAYVLILNNDTIADPGCVAELLAAAAADPAAGLLAPLIYYHDEPDQVWSSGQRDMIRRFWIDLDRNVAPGPVPYPVDFFSGCAMLIRRGLLEQVGLLDESYFMYYEDLDLCLAARRHGFSAVVVPGAKLWHKIGRSSGGSANPRIAYYKSRNIIRVLRRYYPWHLVTLLPFYAAMIALNFSRAFLARRRLEPFWALLRGFGYHFRHNQP